MVVFDRDTERGAAIEAELGANVVFVAGQRARRRRHPGRRSPPPPTSVDCAASRGLRRRRHVVQRTHVGRDGTPHDSKVFTDTVNLNLVGTFNTLRFAASAMNDLEPPTTTASAAPS